VRQYLIASAIIYITGALGMELLGGLYREDRWAGVIVTTIEETLEMVGVVLFIRGLLRYIQEQSDYIQIVMRNPT
jgi:biotin transporter BioY